MTYYSFQPALPGRCKAYIDGTSVLFLSDLRSAGRRRYQSVSFQESAKPLPTSSQRWHRGENSNRKLTSANRELTLELEAQKPLIKNAFYNRLLYGNMESEEELRQDAAMLSFPCEGSVFWTVIFQLIPNADPSQYQPDPLPDAYLLSLQEMIELSIPKAAAVHTGNDALVCIFFCSATKGFAIPCLYPSASVRYTCQNT